MFVGLRIVLQVVAPLIAVAAMAQVGSVPLSIPDTTSAVNSPTPLSQRVVDRLADVDVDGLTPRDALALLAELQNEVKKGGGA